MSAPPSPSHLAATPPPTPSAVNLIATPTPLTLDGCTPEPLMGYLKALGVFRLVSEQADPDCRARWQNGKLVLLTRLTREQLVEFFQTEYAPSPNFSPWNGEGGFLTESGASFSTIEEIRKSTEPRLNNLRGAIEQIESMSILKEFGQFRTESKTLDKKKKAKRITSDETERLKEVSKGVKTLKETILYQIRTEFPDSALGWFDTCLQVGEDGFSVAPALGSGGVDGRMEFSANFFANILTVLKHQESAKWLATSLFADSLSTLHQTSVGQFAPGSIGGPNATQGFEGGSLVNPWDYIFLIEGSSILSGAIARRCRTGQYGKAAFPFTVMPAAQASDSLEAKDSNSARGEIWLPLWPKNLKLNELQRIFGEGRAEWAGGQSRTNVDFAKAVASFGVDRGIGSFSRHGFLQRNGLAFLATPLGRFEVQSREHVHLLHEADDWIARFRRACGDKTPARFGTALRRMDSAVFDYCRFGDDQDSHRKERFQAILIALGQAEREAAWGKKFRESGFLHPLQRLSADWVAAADDRSEEFAIALALAAIQGTRAYPGVRANLEFVDFTKGRWNWHDDSAKTVWKGGQLADNLSAVLERRLLDQKRLGLPHLPIVASRFLSPAIVARFISGELDEDKIERLLWGLICCKIEWKVPYAYPSMDEVPRPYALLKLCFPGVNPEGQCPTGVSADFWKKIGAIKPETRLIPLLRAGRLSEALGIAAQRLRNHGLTPAPIEWGSETYPFDPARLAAALLFPVAASSLEAFWKLIRREKRDEPNHDLTVSLS